MSDDGTGQRARTASFLRRSASANEDRRACPLHYVYRSHIDLRASTSSSTSFRVKKCPLAFAAPMPISSRVRTPQCDLAAARVGDLLRALVMKMKENENDWYLYFEPILKRTSWTKRGGL